MSKKAPLKRAAHKVPHVLVAQGVNLDLLGRREPSLYGTHTLEDIERVLRHDVQQLALLAELPGCDLTFFQSNHEGVFLERLSSGFDGILINPGAWTHTSLALADRLKGLGVPYVEVHLSNIAAREKVRHVSLSAPAAAGCVYGLGVSSYQAGLWGLLLALRRTA